MIKFNAVVGLMFVSYLFQIGVLYWALEVLIFYLVVQHLHRSKIFPYIIWSLSLLVLFCNEKFDGYSFLWIDPESKFWYRLDRNLHEDSMIRWHVVFNMCILKIISYGMDKHWSATK